MTDIQIKEFQKDTWILPMVSYNPDGTEEQLEGVNVKFTVKNSEDEELFTEQTDGVDITRNDEEGFIKITVSKELMDLEVGIYRFGVKFVYPDGREDTQFLGSLKVVKGIVS